MSIELTLLPGVAFRGDEITSPRLRSLLALLATDLKVGASVARLVDGIWADDPPENPTKAVQILISRARSQIAADVIETTPTGYRLSLGDDAVDSEAVLAHAAAAAHDARSGRHTEALRHAEAGLALWDAPPEETGGDRDPVAELRSERVSTYQSLARARALALSRLGRANDAFEPLTRLQDGRPHDEEVLLELLRSEAAAVSQSAALQRYEAYRSRLQDELGSDPGRPLQDLHQELLRSTAPAVRHGLSHEPNRLVGRDDDIAAVADLLHSARVTSIIGPGGLGKTRLAHAVWRHTDQRVGYFVPLAGVTRDEDVLGGVAAAVGAGESSRTAGPRTAHDLTAEIAAVLSPGPALLVLDNCEQVIEGVAELVQSLIAMTSDLRVLTTSRASLDLTSESVYLLPELPQQPAAELFTQRARSTRPDAELPPDLVAEVCRHLDGLPLAIELAAARVRAMSVADIENGLGDKFSLLRGSTRDAPERHRTLRGVIDWSWALLEEPERRAMRILSILPGGFTAQAAGHVLGITAADVADVIQRLVEQSMLRVGGENSDGTRFWMLETVREFSAAERETAGEDDIAVDGSTSWARLIGETHFDGLFGPDPLATIRVVRAERENLGHALRHALNRSDGPTTAATTAALGSLAIAESNYARLWALINETSWLLSHYRPDRSYIEITRTALALSAAYTFVLVGPHAVRSLVALRRLPPPEPETFPGAVTTLLTATNNDEAALLELCDSDDSWVAALANAIVGYQREAEGDLVRALDAARNTLIETDGHDRPWLDALAHTRIGELSFHLERPGDAIHHLSAGLPLFDQTGSRTDAAGLRWWIILAHLQRGDVDGAEQSADEVPEFLTEAKIGTAGYDIGARAEMQLAKGNIDDGLQLWRTAVHTVETTPDQLTSTIPISLDPWHIEARAVAVTAHAQHGHLDLLQPVPAQLEEHLASLLSTPLVKPPPYIIELQLAGTMLVALGMVDVAQGRADAGLRAIALAERLGFLRTFQPTMSSTRIREFAQSADGPAYEDAVSSYAGLDRDALRAATLTLVRQRSRTTA